MSFAELPSPKRRNKNRPVFDPDLLFAEDERAAAHDTICDRLRIRLRALALLFWAACGCVGQGTCLLLPGKMFRRFPLFFWTVACRILNIKVRTIGKMEGSLTLRPDGRRVIYVANHSSWLDVLVLGKVLPAFFIAKQEVRHWPLIGYLTYLGRTIFINRNRQEAGQDVQEVINQLRKGYNIAFFPEGTTSKGTQLLPFMSSLFAIARPVRRRDDPTEDDHPTCLIQPVTVTYDRLEGLPVGRHRRSFVFSWFGDMDFGPHLVGLTRWRSMRATVLFHPPLKPEDFPSRKALSNAARAAIEQGSEDLRQNRLPEDHLLPTTDHTDH
ncbi:1-acyl-sn-glycerol-3-phosphate acyltransferase [Bombella sp. ESL0385]|uniref:lysophospholipid acyltransferase family protein n=1 Tax=Bombella sp. ESL0385 TaxID=2676446 RepID=UPI0012D8E4BA|nr:lysophospholipid acyltransferase family protein [Bombella sp. ESL0385]MUG90273.1 1-acyl-sn-glycerol-3-phosphate acyltransferase [Bombella sp. ESL0385]